jgi:molecular chaperone GrpE
MGIFNLLSEADDMTEDKQDQAAESQADSEDLIATRILPEGAGDLDPATATETEAAAATDAAKDPLAQAQALADENWNKYLRVVAELDNVRKRSSRDVEKARRYGIEGLAQSLLEVADSLEMALEAGAQASAATLLEGSQATLKQLQSVLDKHGIATIYPEGEPFDPELHEAMSMIESDTAEPNTVVAVVQRGYQLNGRLLRPARVLVAKEASQDKN